MTKKKAAKKPRRPGIWAGPGQPTKYREEYCQGVIDHMSTGLSFETYGAVIGVSRETIYEWARVHTPFSDAKAYARDACQLHWEKIGLAGTTNCKDFSTGMWIFNAKCRFPKTFRDVQEVVTRDETLRNPADLTEDQLDDRLAHALKVVDAHESRTSQASDTRKAKKAKPKEADGEGSK